MLTFVTCPSKDEGVDFEMEDGKETCFTQKMIRCMQEVRGQKNAIY